MTTPSDPPASGETPPPDLDLTDAGDYGRHRQRSGGAAGAPARPPRIGRYKILEVLGEGGMGTVYLAEQTAPIRRRVAVKLVRAARFDRQTAHRFEAERQALARMSHPAIAQVYEAGDTESGQPFFAMEHVPGVPITKYCDRERLSIEQRIDLFCAVCGGIQHAHQKGILHRDIKPANILVATEQGRPVPKIIDFGIAKALDPAAGESQLTVDGMVVGTPSYLSPESVAAAGEGADPDTRSDVFALGVLLFELLVGSRPFGKAGNSLLEILRLVGEGEVPPPSARWRELDGESRARLAAARATTPAALARRLAGDLDAIVLQATARDRDRRYGSAAELAADLERHRRFRPISARPPGRFYALGKLVRRHRAAAIGAVLVFAALAAGVVARSLEARRANQEAAAARRAEAETRQVVEFLVDLFEVNDPGTARGETITARELLDRAAADIRSRLGEQPLARARLLDTIGLVYRRMDLPGPARPLLEEALAIRERELGAAHPEVATSLDHLGDLLWIGGEYPGAEEALRRALAIREAALGPDAPEVAEVLDHLGSVYEIQAKYAEALPLLERALAIREARFGPDDLEVAASLDDLGVCKLDQGDAAAAEPYFRRALAIREARLGPDHPDVAVSANGLAIALFQLDRAEESIAAHRRALAVREKVFGPESSPVAQSLNNLASVYVGLGRLDESEGALLRAAAIWQKVLGSEHPRYGIVLYNLADTYHDRGEPARAEPLFERVVAIFEKAYGPTHPRLAYGLAGLAESLAAQGRRAAALPLCRRALEIRAGALGPDDELTAATRADCAALESPGPATAPTPAQGAPEGRMD